MNVSITICQSRAEAETRKNDIKELAPNANWKTRMIDGVESLSVGLLHSIQNDPVSILSEPVSSLNGGPERAVVLIMWIETP